MSEITENIKLELWDETDVAKPQEQSPEFNYIKTIYNNFKRTDTAIGKNRQAINIEQNLLSGVEEVEILTSPATWFNRSWRTASGGTGTRERIDVENAPNSQFQKGWRFATNTTTGSTDIAQDLVPVTVGESYRLSCYARKFSGEPTLKMQYGKGAYVSKLTKIENTDWQKYIFEFKMGEKNDGSLEGNTNIYLGSSNKEGVLEICGMRLEKIDTEQDKRITLLEKENEYLKELNDSLQETVLDGQTEVAETVVVNDSCEGIGMINVHGGQKQEVIELPSIYQRVEYLESTGTQYIDTGYLSNSKTKIEVDFAYTDFTVKQGRIFGCYGDLVTSLYVNSSGNFAWACQNTEGNWTNMGITADTQEHHFELDIANKTVKFDNAYTNNFSSISANNTASRILCIYSMGDTKLTEHYSKSKLYNFKIYENNIIVRNFVACYRKSDNVAGLYDLVNNVFYENSGTGSFVVGENKNNIIAPTIECLSEIEVVGDNINELEDTGVSKTENGVTFTKTNEGILVNGTATANVAYTFDNGFKEYSAGQRVLSGCPARW